MEAYKLMDHVLLVGGLVWIMVAHKLIGHVLFVGALAGIMVTHIGPVLFVGALAGTMVAHKLMSAIKSKCSTEEAREILAELPNPLSDAEGEVWWKVG